MKRIIIAVDVPEDKVTDFENLIKVMDEILVINTIILPRPTDDDIYEYAEFKVPIEHEEAFPYVAKWLRSKVWGE